MKNKIQQLAIFCMAVLFLATACTDNFEDINTNPNEPTEVPPGFLLTAAQKQLADNLWGSFELGYFGNLYGQYWSQNQYTEESRWQFREGVNNALWADYYAAITDLEEIIEIDSIIIANSSGDAAISSISNNRIGIARVMKAWTYQVLTDIYGDVPYFEAIQAREIPSPAYTPQQEIYADLLMELTEASAQMDASAESFGSADLIYGGDVGLWKKFANSLRMRVAVRLSDVAPDVAGPAIQQALSAGVFTSIDDNALLGYLPSVPNNNPINETYKTRDDFAISDALIGVMLENNDPRLPAFATKAEDCDCYDGFAYGLSGGLAASVPRNSFSRPSERVREATAPAIFMLYSEVLFIQAEAAQRGFIAGDAATLYGEAIEASMNYWGVTDQGAINAYIAGVPYDAGNWQQVLGVQKWLSLYMQGLQGWFEFRRLDFTGVLQAPASGPLLEFATTIPVRYPYPFDEENRNSANLQEAVSRQGPDTQGTRVYWDVQ